MIHKLYAGLDWCLDRAFGNRVWSGPFAGMRYNLRARWGPNSPKILGTYEKELHGVVEKVLQWKPPFVIDVGAAEGYYAVGLARALPTTRVIAFEADPVSQVLLGDLAARNGVGDRIEVQGFCTCPLLQKALEAAVDPLVIMDVEGCENELLTPMECPGLTAALILLELHETTDAQMGATIKSRFDQTHDIEEIVQTDRSVGDLPFRPPEFALRLCQRILKRAMNERRSYQMRWLFMQPKDRSSVDKR